MRFFGFILMGLAAGTLITLQSVANAALGKRTGSLGSVLIVTVVSALILAVVIPLLPGTANLKHLPGPSEWYLYLGGLLGIGILAAPIFLLPRIGATSTLTALVVGQLVAALVIDNFGLFNLSRIEINVSRVIGIALLAVGAFLIVRK